MAHLLLNLILYMMILIKYSVKCALISLQFLSPGTDFELREDFRSSRFQRCFYLITLETQMDIIRYVFCCSKNLSKSLKGEFICILKSCIQPFSCVN